MNLRIIECILVTNACIVILNIPSINLGEWWQIVTLFSFLIFVGVLIYFIFNEQKLRKREVTKVSMRETNEFLEDINRNLRLLNKNLERLNENLKGLDIDTTDLKDFLRHSQEKHQSNKK